MYMGVTTHWAIAELLRGTVRKFPGEAPGWTQLLSVRVRHVLVADRQ